MDSRYGISNSYPLRAIETDLPSAQFAFSQGSFQTDLNLPARDYAIQQPDILAWQDSEDHHRACKWQKLAWRRHAHWVVDRGQNLGNGL